MQAHDIVIWDTAAYFNCNGLLGPLLEPGETEDLIAYAEGGTVVLDSTVHFRWTPSALPGRTTFAGQLQAIGLN